jgi:hypothetical protein
MSCHRSNPPPQHQSPPPRYDIELGHAPTHNFDQGSADEQRRGKYQARRNLTQTMTSGSHRDGPSNDLPPPAQHNILQNSNHGPRPSLDPGYEAQIRDSETDHMYHSALPMPSLHHHPIPINDRYGPPDQRSMAGERSFNNVNREPRPSRSLRREGNDPIMDYGPGSHFRSDIDQDPPRVAHHPAYPSSGMQSGLGESDPFAPRHTYRCSCPRCIAVATMRLDREKAEREEKQIGKIAARLGYRRSYNDEPSPSRYRDPAH